MFTTFALSIYISQPALLCNWIRLIPTGMRRARTRHKGCQIYQVTFCSPHYTGAWVSHIEMGTKHSNAAWRWRPTTFFELGVFGFFGFFWSSASQFTIPGLFFNAKTCRKCVTCNRMLP